jgi:hypothetical protein
MDRQSSGCGLTLAYVAAWLVSTALVLIDVLLVRQALLSILTWLGTRGGQAPSAYSGFGWTIEFVDRAALLILACAGLGLSVALQYYYRQGADNGVLTRRVIRGMGILLAAGLAAWVLQVLF